MDNKERRRQRMEGSLTVRSHLAELVARKGEKTGAVISQHQVSRDTGITLNTVRKYWHSRHEFFDGRVVAMLCKYLECEIGDLLKIVEAPDVEQSSDTEDLNPLQ